MQHKIALYKNLGMKRDQSNNLPAENFAYENMNIRLTANADESLLSVTNEKGTKLQSITDKGYNTTYQIEVGGQIVTKPIAIQGVLLGHCVLNKYLILFTTETVNKIKTDYIYRLVKSDDPLHPDTFILTILAMGEFNFSKDHPIETLGYIDTESIQKVYWVDGYNYPRLINIIGETDNFITPVYPYKSKSQFDFTPEVSGNGTTIQNIKVSKANYSGQFKAGVISYAYTYFNKYGAETNIIDVSDIQYIAKTDRGGSPEETIATAFEITIENPNQAFDYVRIYSIIRTSYNGEMSVNMVAELPINKTAELPVGQDTSVSYIDLNTDHEAIDPSYLTYIGGSAIIASTLDFKDDLLFLGDIRIKHSSISQELLNAIGGWITVKKVTYNDGQEIKDFNDADQISWIDTPIQCNSTQEAYNYFSQINKYSQKEITTFKRDEIYRFGIQFQDKKGSWTDVVWIGDKIQNHYSDTLGAPLPRFDEQTGLLHITKAQFTLPALPTGVYYKNSDGEDYVNYKLCIAETSYANRTILAQGIVSPTVFNYKERCNHQTFAESSWLYRVNNSGMAHKHLQNLPKPTSKYAEIQGITNAAMPPIAQEDVTWAYDVIVFNLYGWNPAGYQLEGFYYRIHQEITNDSEWDTLTDDKTQDNYYELIKETGFNRTSAGNAQSMMYNFLRDNGLPTELPTPKHVKARLQLAVNQLWTMSLASILFPGIGTLVMGSLNAAQNDRMYIPHISELASAEKYDVLDDIVAQWSKSGAAFTSAEVTKDFIYNGYITVMDGNSYPSGAHSKVFCNGGIPIWMAGSYHIKEQGGVKYVEKGTVKMSIIKIIPRAVSKATDPAIRKKVNNYYVDSNILTLNYPEYEDTYQLVHDQNLKFRLVGIAEINNTFSNSLIQAGIGAISNSGVEDMPDMSYTGAGLFNEVLFRDGPIIQDAGTGIYHYKPNDLAYYKIFMWHQEVSLIGYTNDILDGSSQPFTYTPASLERKVFANLRQSVNTTFQTNNNYWSKSEIPVQIFNSDSIALSKLLYRKDEPIYYQGNYDKILTFNVDTEYYNPINTYNRYGTTEFNPEVNLIDAGNDYPINLNAPVRIKYNVTPHAVFALGEINHDTDQRLMILPHLANEEPWSLLNIYGDDIKDSTLYGWDNKDANTQLPIAFLINTEPATTASSPHTITTAINEQITGECNKLKIDLAHALSEVDDEGKTKSCDVVLISNIQEDGTKKLYKVNQLNNNSFYFTSTIENDTQISTNGMWYEFTYAAEESEITLPNSAVIVSTITPNDEKSITISDTDNANEITYSNQVFKEKTLQDTIIDILVQQAGFTDYINKYTKEEQESIKFSLADYYYNGQLKALSEGNIPTLKYNYTPANQFNYSLYPIGDTAPTFSINGQTYYWVSDSIGFVSPSNQVSWSGYKRAQALGAQFLPLSKGSITYAQNSADGLSLSKSDSTYVFIGELYRDLAYKSLYGGVTPNAINNLKWVEASLSTGIGNLSNKTNLWGDTYYQQWDSLKTYPTTEEDKNSITESLSCMLETHINLDGRQDQNRGIGNMLNFRPTNTNILNRVYSQQTAISFKNSHQSDMIDDYFPTEVIWSKPKLNASDVDNWTQFIGSNMLTLDGKYGYLKKLLKVNNEIIAFQESGISQIRYNERTQTAAQIGVPIEIMNNNAVTGYYYISHNIGCKNKWSIANTSNGVFFVDDLNKSLYQFNKEGLANISQTQAFSIWFKRNLPENCIWTPNNVTAYRSFYDNVNNDLYLTSSNKCLVYSSTMQSFTSFMSYNGASLIERLYGTPVTLKYGLYQGVGIQSLYEMFAGDYNDFYGAYEPYYVTYRVAPNPYSDCLFTNIEFTADITNQKTTFNGMDDFDQFKAQIDSYKGNVEYMQRRLPFNKMYAWNEYQTGEKILDIKYNYDRDISKKFRIWRADIPRTGTYNLDRMRNPWIYLKLSKENINDNNKVYSDKFILHDLKVHYYK